MVSTRASGYHPNTRRFTTSDQNNRLLLRSHTGPSLCTVPVCSASKRACGARMFRRRASLKLGPAQPKISSGDPGGRSVRPTSYAITHSLMLFHAPRGAMRKPMEEKQTGHRKGCGRLGNKTPTRFNRLRSYRRAAADNAWLAVVYGRHHTEGSPAGRRWRTLASRLHPHIRSSIGLPIINNRILAPGRFGEWRR